MGCTVAGTCSIWYPIKDVCKFLRSSLHVVAWPLLSGVLPALAGKPLDHDVESVRDGGSCI